MVKKPLKECNLINSQSWLRYQHFFTRNGQVKWRNKKKDLSNKTKKVLINFDFSKQRIDKLFVSHHENINKIKL